MATSSRSTWPSPRRNPLHGGRAGDDDRGSGHHRRRDVPAIAEPLDVNPGWTIQNSDALGWAFGSPVGGGGLNGPTTGHTGTKVYGTNLTGQYGNDADYKLSHDALQPDAGPRRRASLLALAQRRGRLRSRVRRRLPPTARTSRTCGRDSGATRSGNPTASTSPRSPTVGPPSTSGSASSPMDRPPPAVSTSTMSPSAVKSCRPRRACRSSRTTSTTDRTAPAPITTPTRPRRNRLPLRRLQEPGNGPRCRRGRDLVVLDPRIGMIDFRSVLGDVPPGGTGTASTASGSRAPPLPRARALLPRLLRQRDVLWRYRCIDHFHPAGRRRRAPPEYRRELRVRGGMDAHRRVADRNAAGQGRHGGVGGSGTPDPPSAFSGRRHSGRT
jgi:hypothetical protein